MTVGNPHEARRAFGLALRQRRIERGLTQEQLSHETGIRQSYISEVEAGRRNISIDNIECLARALEWPIGAFFAVEERSRKAVPRDTDKSR